MQQLKSNAKFKMEDLQGVPQLRDAQLEMCAGLGPQHNVPGMRGPALIQKSANSGTPGHGNVPRMRDQAHNTEVTAQVVTVPTLRHDLRMDIERVQVARQREQRRELPSEMYMELLEDPDSMPSVTIGMKNINMEACCWTPPPT